VPTSRISGHVLGVFLLLLGLSICAACASSGPETVEPKLVPEADLGSGAEPSDKAPLAGIELGKLNPEKTELFYKLVNSLGSPCGKSHSLRTSFTSDPSCKRAPFAVRYLRAMLEDDGPEGLVREDYAKHYERKSPLEQLDASRAPHFGDQNAPIKLVEFMDYECPHCAVFKGELDKLLVSRAGKVEIFVMMYPLEQHHPESKSAAQAALAAAAQGKFQEMHDLLFAQTPKHSRDEVLGYGKQLGLDVDKFTAAYDAAERHVSSDQAQGNAAGVDATPTVYLQDRKYDGPMSAKYLELWIDEELAVPR